MAMISPQDKALRNAVIHPKNEILRCRPRIPLSFRQSRAGARAFFLRDLNSDLSADNRTFAVSRLASAYRRNDLSPEQLALLASGSAAQ